MATGPSPSDPLAACGGGVREETRAPLGRLACVANRAGGPPGPGLGSQGVWGVQSLVTADAVGRGDWDHFSMQ
eukprot:7849395-Heterocapsa_arctica.AAC.1